MTTGTASLSETGGALVAPVRPGEVVAGKYRVEQTLGVGGMGVVVAARDEVLERRVAIKFLLPRLAGSEIAVQRFVREARAATRVTSEHVVRLLEIDELPNGTPFFVMEYLEGSDLRAVLRDGGPLPPSVAVDYVLQALEAVAEGHLKNIVHRDLKPGNLFLTARADGTPLIKVLDFGIAKRLESREDVEQSSLTSSDDVRLGSPAYMPPEQLHDPRDVDTRSDIWSIGATLYELVCGKQPFEGPGYLELVTRILSSPPKPAGRRLPEGLEDVLRKCLEKERSARYADAAELARALAPFGGAEAQLSLSRVAGLLSTSTAAPASRKPRSPIEPAGSSTTTFPVATERIEAPLDASPPSSTLAGVRRSWWVVGGVAGLLAVGLALHGATSGSTASDLSKAVQPGSAAGVVLSAAVAPPEPASPREHAAPGQAPAASANLALPVSSQRAASATARRAEPRASKETPQAAPQLAPARSEPEPARAAAAQPASEPDAARSEVIERLIERRR